MAMPQDFVAAGADGEACDVSVFFDSDTTLILLFGDVDLALAEDLEWAGRDAIDRGLPVSVDVGRVGFMDSVGVAFIVRLAAAGQQSGWRLAVLDASRRVLEALDLTGVVSLMDFRWTRVEA